MGENPRPLRYRTGNTVRREPKRALRGQAKLPGEVLHIPRASVEARQALNLPSGDNVPYSLKKKRRWEVLEELSCPVAECSVRVEEITEMTRLRRGPNGHRRLSVKEVRRTERVVAPSGRAGREELHLRICRPLTAAQLGRKRCLGGRNQPRQSRATADLQPLDEEFDVDLEPLHSDSEISSNREGPSDGLQSLMDFVSDRVPVAARCERKRKLKKKKSFQLFPLPSVPSQTFAVAGAAPGTPEPEEKAERTLSLEDPVLMLQTRVTIPAELIRPQVLRCTFGERHWEGTSHPRRFAIDISAGLRSAAHLHGPQVSAMPLAFLVFEVVRETREEAELALFLNGVLRGEDTLTVAPSAVAHSNFEALVESCTEAAAARYGGLLEEAAADLQLLLLPSRGGPEPLTGGLPTVCSQAAMSSSSMWSHGASLNGVNIEATVADCGIRFEAVTEGHGCRLHCGHLFCEPCWRAHLVAEVRKGRRELRCAAVACQEHTDLATALRFVSLTVLEQHWKLTTAAALEEGGLTAFCPSRQCHRALRLTGAGDASTERSVRCLCGHVFCFACTAEGHWPASCAAFQEYRTMARQLGRWCDGDEDQAVRVKVFGQRCPKCRRFFERSSGCNSMICYCGASFCYQCGKASEEHRVCVNYSRFTLSVNWILKTRFTAPERPAQVEASTSCPVELKRALEVRDRRTALGNGFQFRRRFGPVLARLSDVRSTYCLQKCAAGQWLTVYYGVTDIFRAAEYCQVAQCAIQNGNKLRRRRFQDHSDTLCIYAEEILQLLESQTATKTLLNAILSRAEAEIRIIARLLPVS